MQLKPAINADPGASKPNDARPREPLCIVCTPSWHASGRQIFDQNATLWASWSLVGPGHRVYFSGDTGLFPAMKTIGEQLGPFNLMMIETGAYDKAWPDWHIGPEQAVLAHTWLRGQHLMPIHWGLFNLANHGWTEPVERVVASAKRVGVSVLVPPPGGSVEPEIASELEPWWPALPWRRGHEAPIVSTGVDYAPGHRRPAPTTPWPGQLRAQSKMSS